MARNDEMMQLVLAWTLVGAFVFTVVLTLLSLPGWIRFADRQQQKKLFYALIVELMTGTLAWFFGYIRLDARDVARTVEERSRLHERIASAESEPRPAPSDAHVGEIARPSTWSSDNLAATATWAILQHERGLPTSFRSAARTTVRDLALNDAIVASDSDVVTARSFAMQLDHGYRVLLRARFEPAVDAQSAIRTLESVLGDPDRTIMELASVADTLYLFAGE